MTKVCMVTRAYPPRIGGTGSMIEQVSKRLIDEGFEVVVITQKIKEAKGFERKDGVEIHRCFNLSDKNEFSFANTALSIPALSKEILRNRNSDIIHAHDISFAGFSTCLSKFLIRDKKFLLKYGGDLVFEYLSLKKFKGWNPKNGLEETLKWKKGFAGLLHKLQDWYFKKYDFVCPDSGYGYDFLERRGIPKEKLKLLYNGVDMQKFSVLNKDESKEKLGLSGKIVFSASRLVEWKGIGVLIEAFSRTEDNDAKLLIAGSGPEEANLKNLVKKLNMEDKVLFIGNITRQEMPLYLNASDVFALTSYFDTTPNALLEAMSCGCSCLVSDIRGVKGVVGRAALKVLPGDVDSIHENLSQLLSDENKRKKLGKQANEIIKNRFEISLSAKEYIKFYRSIL